MPAEAGGSGGRRSAFVGDLVAELDCQLHSHDFRIGSGHRESFALARRPDDRRIADVLVARALHLGAIGRRAVAVNGAGEGNLARIGNDGLVPGDHDRKATGLGGELRTSTLGILLHWSFS